MGMYWRRMAIRLVLPLTWNVSKRHAADILQRFSTTEADGAWQFLYALNKIDNPAHRANLFANALEEVCHASKFERAALSYRAFPVVPPTMERKPLFDPKNGLFEFLAHIYVGEKAVYDQFSAYLAAIGKKDKIESIFMEAQEDEDGHVELAKQVLLELGQNERAIKKSLLRIRIRRAWESWLRFSKVLGEFMSVVLLGTLYYAVGPFVVYTCRRRLRGTDRPETTGLP